MVNILELYELLLKLVHEPLRIGTLIALALFIIDRLFKQLFIRHVRKLLHIKDRNGVDLHMQRLNDIENKLDILLREKGLLSEVVRSSANVSRDTVWKRRKYWRSFVTTPIIVNFAGKFIKSGVHEMKLNKAILIPLLSAIALFVKQAFGYEISSEYVDMSANVILLLLTVLGTFIQPKKAEKPDLNYME